MSAGWSWWCTKRTYVGLHCKCGSQRPFDWPVLIPFIRIQAFRFIFSVKTRLYVLIIPLEIDINLKSNQTVKTAALIIQLGPVSAINHLAKSDTFLGNFKTLKQI